MVKIRNYGVGTGYTSSGITDEKSVFDFDEKVYACHVWDEVFSGASFRIDFQRKVNTSWVTEVSKFWQNPDYTSIYHWAWIQNYTPGSWRVRFMGPGAVTYYSNFTIKAAPTPPDEPIPDDDEVPTPPTPPAPIPGTRDFDPSLPYTYYEADQRVWQYFADENKWYVYNHGKPEISNLIVTVAQWEDLTKPGYPKDVSRGLYTIRVDNAEQEAQAKEFLGIEPPGDTLDTWLSKRDLAGLEQWKNYWTDIFSKVGMAFWIDFVNNKFEEYKALLPAAPTIFEIFLNLLPKPVSDLIEFIQGLTEGNINEVLESLLKLPDGESQIEVLGMKAFDELVKAAPEYEVLRDAPKGSISIAVIIGIVTLILGIGTVVGWLRKEAPEPSGMAVWAAIEAKDWETANTANQQYRDFISKMNFWIPTAISWLNPFLAGFISTNADSQRAGADAYQKIIDDNLAVKTGRLIIHQIPPDAKIEVQDQFPTTTVFDKELPIGTYSWTVSKFGWISKSGTIDLTEAGAEFSVEIVEGEVIPPTLEAKLIISVVPSDAVITVAAHPEIDSPGTYEIDPGSYTITFSKSGFESQSRTIYVSEGKTETVSVILKEIPPVIPPEEIKGSLTITVIPGEVVVEIAGQPDIIEPGTYELLTGSYTIKVSKEGFISQSKNAYVNEGKDTVVSFILEEVEAPAELPTKSTIIITSEPTNSDIYIDGKYTFTKTPFTTVLEAGTYIIRVQTDGYYPAEATVTFGEGDEVTVPFILIELPEEVVPTVVYDPYEPWLPDYQPTTYYTPAVQPTPYSQISVPDYSLITAPTFKSVIEPVYPAVVEKEIMINIETTDVKPWLGKIFSIAWLDLTTPGAEAQVIVDEDEKGILEAFINAFNAGNFKTILGYNLKFDYQWIFNKLMLYRIPANKFYETDMRDVYQLMSQIKEEFVYNARAYGTLNEYAKELLGIGKMGTQETLMRRYIAGDLAYVEAFQFRQLEITNGLYQLFRYCSSESFISPILSSPILPEGVETPLSPETPIQTGQKQCANCLAYNPITATQCEVCGGTIFK